MGGGGRAAAEGGLPVAGCVVRALPVAAAACFHVKTPLALLALATCRPPTGCSPVMAVIAVIPTIAVIPPAVMATSLAAAVVTAPVPPVAVAVGRGRARRECGTCEAARRRLNSGAGPLAQAPQADSRRLCGQVACQRRAAHASHGCRAGRTGRPSCHHDAGRP